MVDADVARAFHQLLDKQPNFIFGLAGACGDKIKFAIPKAQPCGCGA
jgi:hypothetical protein